MDNGSDDEVPGSEDGDAGGGGDGQNDGEPPDGDRFAVGIQLTESELTFVVHVPSDIDSGWRDPEAFQSLVERQTWKILDQESTLRTIAAERSPGETVRLGHITLQPDGTVVDHELSAPTADADPS